MSDALPLTEQDRADRPVWTLSVYALVRTALSSERSLMAWMRTSVSLYSFGFTITKFANYLQARGGSETSLAGPFRLGLMLICLGIIGLMLGMIDHSRRLYRMRRIGLPRISPFSLPLATSAALLVVGIGTLVEIIPI